MRWTRNEILLAGAIFVLFFFRNRQATVLFVAVVAYVAVRVLWKNPPVIDGNKFLIDHEKDSQATAELDAGLNRQRLRNHFRTDARFLTRYTTSLYEYRVQGTEVFHRLLALETEEIGEPKHFEVRDGVVLESEMRTLAEGHTDIGREFTEDRIANLEKEVEWTPMTPILWHGLKYFIVAKKLPKPDARRYLRQELERIKAGTAAFYKEAEKYGLEPGENSLERLKVAAGKPTPKPEDYRKLNESAAQFGITDLEFSWGKELCGVLEKLLGDNA